MAASWLKALTAVMTGGNSGYKLQAGNFFVQNTATISGAVQTIAPAATVTPNLLSGSQVQVTYSANTVVVFQIPTGLPAGQIATFTITIINTSGGSLTNTTFAAAYKTASLSYPATAKNRTYSFYTDGTNAYQITDAADVAN